MHRLILLLTVTILWDLPCYIEARKKKQPLRQTRCQNLQSSICTASKISYNMTYLEDFQRQADVEQQAKTYLPLFQSGCSSQMLEFACRTIFPECVDNAPLRPCRRLCKAARHGCETVLNSFGLQWSDAMNCDELPITNCGDVKAAKSTTVLPSATGRCEMITAGSICSSRISYNMVFYPNMVGQERQIDAEMEFRTFLPLLQAGCSEALPELVCRVYFPECVDNSPHPPCRNLCLTARQDCAALLRSFGFIWPNSLHCDNFPTTDCAGGAAVTIQPSTSPRNSSRTPNIVRANKLLKKTRSTTNKIKKMVRNVGETLIKAKRIRNRNGGSMDINRAEDILSALNLNANTLLVVLDELQA